MAALRVLGGGLLFAGTILAILWGGDLLAFGFGLTR